jgi:predicted nucleic acid-binding protein
MIAQSNNIWVIDTSAALSWVIPDESIATVIDWRERLRDNLMLIPHHWFVEVANVLSQAVRKKRITAAQRLLAFQALETLNLHVDTQTALSLWPKWSVLADTHQLSVYDAAYLELAIRNQAGLITLDKALLRASQSCSLPVETINS